MPYLTNHAVILLMLLQVEDLVAKRDELAADLNDALAMAQRNLAARDDLQTELDLLHTELQSSHQREEKLQADLHEKQRRLESYQVP